MTDSLLLSNSLQLMQFGVPSTNPLCPGAIFQIQPGYDLGAPQPTTNIVASLLLDGERPMGDRFSNRLFVIPVLITGTSRANLAAAKEVLLSIVNQDTWTMTWCRDGGLNLIYDCFRAQPSVITDNIIADRACVATVTLTIPAMPFGRSDTYQILSFPGSFSVGGVAAPPSPVTLDAYTTVSGTNWSQQTAGAISADCAHWTNPNTGIPAIYTSTFSAKNITGLTTLTHYIGIATNNPYWYGNYGYGFDPGNLSVGYVLTDSGGHQISIGTYIYIYESYSTNSPSWEYITVSIPQGVSGFNYAAVTSVTVTITNYQGYEVRNTDVFLDALIAVPNTVAPVAPPINTRGAITNLAGVIGTSHAPLNFQVLSAAGSGSPFDTLLLHRPGVDAPTTLTPMVVVNNSTGGSAYNDAPTGTIYYTVPSLISGQNATFNGTYSILLINYTWNSPTVARTIAVTVTQWEYPGQVTTTVDQQTQVIQTITPSTQVINGIVALGELTLPNRDIAPENTQAYFSVSVYSSNNSDRFYDVLFLDTMGQTVLVNIPTGSTSYANYWVDEPSIDRDLGRVLGSSTDRTRAVSVLDNTLVSGGPMTVDPGANILLSYSLQGAPGLVASYMPRWWRERLQ
jgi:hypothetical protein